MKRKNLLMQILLIVILIFLTGCNNQNDIIKNEENKQNIIQEEEVTKSYKWIIEPKIEADDIIDLDTREEVSLIKKGKKYNFINNDQGKELLRKDFFGYAALDDGKIYIWEEGAGTFKVNEDYTLEAEEYAGDYSPHNVYFNTQRKEFFEQNHTYLLLNNDNKEIIEKHKNIHGTALEPFVEVTPDSFIDDEFDKYAEFSENNLGKYGYYNKENLEIEILPIYENAFNFYDGYAAVKKDGKAGFIDISGKEVFPFEFEETRSLDRERAWVKLDGKWGVIEFIK